MKYFALLTKLGENLIAQATALGTKIELTHMAVGDGGGTLPTPDTNQTKLIAEKRRAAINTLFIDEKNKNQIVAEQIIPESEGGWWIREIGLFDKTGNLIAVANCPETYKPQLAEGSGRTQSIRMVLIVSHTDAVILKIDPSVVLATREYVNTEITVLDKKIDALSTQNKLDLSKKFDKANISSVKGNDNDKVPSLNLFTTETGKLQPKGDYALKGDSYPKTESDGRYQLKGDYAPSGDYATNTALNNGLALKFNKSGGYIDGRVDVDSVITASQVVARTPESSTLQLNPTDVGPRIEHRVKNSSWFIHSLQNANGTLMHLGDYGFGGFGLDKSLSEEEITTYLMSRDTPSQIFRYGNAGTFAVGFRYAPIMYSKVANTWNAVTADIFGAGLKVSSGDDTRIVTYNVWTDKNTTVDRNGNLKVTSASELSDYPVGSPIPWTQATAPAGYLVCNGQSFNKTTYPFLAKAYPSGLLPDLRAEFIRGLDAGRGIDTGRAALSSQEDELKAHTHTVGGIYGGDSIGGKMRVQRDGTAQVSSSTGGNETRPRNIAFLYIVRAA